MRCIVGYEATPQGLDSLNLGIEMAKTFGYDLEIVLVLRRHDVFSAEYPPIGGVADILVSQAFKWLEGALARVPEGINARGHVFSGTSTADGLLRAREELGARIIVVGGASSSPLKRHKLGTVAHDLLFGCPVPVALAPRGYTPHPVARINCAVGTRPGSGSLVSEGLLLAGAADLPLRLVALVGEEDNGDALTRTQSVLDEARAGLNDVAEAAAASDMDAAEARRQQVEVDIAIGKSTDVNHAIENVGWDDGDILFVGSSRIEQKHSVFAGSVAMRILRFLTVPLVVVPRGYDARKRWLK